MQCESDSEKTEQELKTHSGDLIGNFILRTDPTKDTTGLRGTFETRDFTCLEETHRGYPDSGGIWEDEGGWIETVRERERETCFS